MLKIFGNKRLQRPRCLRYYKRVAKKSYKCQTCQFEIGAGEEYEAYVMVYEKKLWVSRHHFPYCPVDPDEEERILKDLEQIRKEENNKESERKKVA